MRLNINHFEYMGLVADKSPGSKDNASFRNGGSKTPSSIFNLQSKEKDYEGTSKRSIQHHDNYNIKVGGKTPSPGIPLEIDKRPRNDSRTLSRMNRKLITNNNNDNSLLSASSNNSKHKENTERKPSLRTAKKSFHLLENTLNPRLTIKPPHPITPHSGLRNNPSQNNNPSIHQSEDSSSSR